MTKSTLLGGVFLGHQFHQDINKFWLNTIERRTNVREGYYQNIGDLNLFYEKKDGEFIPCYGIEDRKIAIGEDLLPKNTYVINSFNVEEKNKESIFEIVNILDKKIEHNINKLNENEKEDLIYKINDISDILNSSNQKLDTNYQIINMLNKYKANFQ